MSQIIKNLASGPVPPAVATSYVTDVRDNTISGPGASIPALNVENVLGRDTIQNNDNGIRTDSDPNNGNFLYVELTNRIVVTATTSDGAGQTQTVVVMTPANASAVEFTGSFIGYDAINNEAAGGSQEGISRKLAGVVTTIGTNDSLDESDPGLAAVDWDIIASGGDLSARFVGIAGRTISWKCLFTYTQT